MVVERAAGALDAGAFVSAAPLDAGPLETGRVRDALTGGHRSRHRTLDLERDTRARRDVQREGWLDLEGDAADLEVVRCRCGAVAIVVPIHGAGVDDGHGGAQNEDLAGVGGATSDLGAIAGGHLGGFVEARPALPIAAGG